MSQKTAKFHGKSLNSYYYYIFHNINIVYTHKHTQDYDYLQSYSMTNYNLLVH